MGKCSAEANLRIEAVTHFSVVARLIASRNGEMDTVEGPDHLAVRNLEIGDRVQDGCGTGGEAGEQGENPPRSSRENRGPGGPRAERRGTSWRELWDESPPGSEYRASCARAMLNSIAVVSLLANMMGTPDSN